MRRPERVAELLREEITNIVGYELDDPRVHTVTVTDVRVADNLRDAKVYVMVAGSEAETAAALVALKFAAPYIRGQVAVALDVRYAPHLHFVRDTVEERAERIENLLTNIKTNEQEVKEQEEQS